MDDGGALADDHAVGQRHNHEMTRRSEIGGKPVRPHRLVEHVFGDMHHKGVIARFQPSDFDRHCVNSSKSAHKL
ncbi:hypothetical protein AJ88_00215 [Mesorhizobium amorphae CCBAU 01583]|nr:hypothetical protein AJ88_00215 [Mesorhizobium amorphae CCBAU 01583]